MNLSSPHKSSDQQLVSPKGDTRKCLSLCGKNLCVVFEKNTHIHGTNIAVGMKSIHSYCIVKFHVQ